MKLKYIFPLLFSFLVLYSCEELFECILGLEPEINESRVEPAKLGEPYLAKITAEINNEVNDNA